MESKNVVLAAQIRKFERRFELDIEKLLHLAATQALPAAKAALLKPDPKPVKDTHPAAKEPRVRRSNFQIDGDALTVATIVYKHPEGISMGAILEETGDASKVSVGTSMRRAIEHQLIRMTGTKRGAKYSPWAANDGAKSSVN